LFLVGDLHDKSEPPPLLLASTSRYRRALLERLALPFEIADPGVDESARAHEPPPERAQRLARAKAEAIAARQPGAWVIGSDQVCAAGAQVLGKPGNAQRCAAQLAALSGGTASFFTACALVRGTRCHEHLDVTRVTFRALSAADIARYVEKDQPYDCAGGFKAEGLGIALFARLESEDPTGLIGLPLIWLAAALRTAGYRVP
jgi:septum formation protein